MSGRWQYNVVEVPSIVRGVLLGKRQTPEGLQAELNRQGQLGWELVQILSSAPVAAPLRLVFKRPA